MGQSHSGHIKNVFKIHSLKENKHEQSKLKSKGFFLIISKLDKTHVTTRKADAEKMDSMR